VKRGLVFVSLLAGLAGCSAGGQLAALRSAPLAFTQKFEFANGSAGKRISHYVFLNGTTSGNVYAYDADTGALAAVCTLCGGGAGLTTDRRSGDIAIGTFAGTVTVWHVRGLELTRYATLTLTSGSYTIGIAFDSRGNLYAVDDPAFDVIDVFSASTIASGGGPASATFFPRDVSSANYLLGDGTDLLLSGYRGAESIGARLSGDGGWRLKAGIFKRFGKLGGGGFALDAGRNLIVSDGRDTLSVFRSPWTGKPSKISSLGFQAQGIALDTSGTKLWATELIPGKYGASLSNAVALDYPKLAGAALRTAPVEDLFLDIALSPLN